MFICSHLVEHWGEQQVVLAVDQHDVDVAPLAKVCLKWRAAYAPLKPPPRISTRYGRVRELL
jgi:hypothetical protein